MFINFVTSGTKLGWCFKAELVIGWYQAWRKLQTIYSVMVSVNHGVEKSFLFEDDLKYPSEQLSRHVSLS